MRFSYAPRGAKVHLALVGKGITFDTGGLNLKPADGMYTMKCDMAGAAAVLAATHAIAEFGLKIKVTAYAALAENMPSGSAYRPSDVLTQYGGKTVENGNSDAEGRLVMADALARAGEDQPDLIIDVATLTGACVVALGERTGGLMTNDDDLADRVLDAAETAGEAFWQLPIPTEIRPKLESKVADLRSTSNDRYGGALVAAAFLREFVAEGTPWAHLDIAGPAFFDGKPYGYVSPGGPASVSARWLPWPGPWPADSAVRAPGRSVSDAVVPRKTVQIAASDRSRLWSRGVWKLSAQVAMLLVAGVVVAHPLRIADDGRVVSGDLQMFCERVRPLRRRHDAPGPLAVERHQQQRGLGDSGLGLDEGLHAATGPDELREMGGHRVVDGATLRRVAAALLRPSRRPPKPTHVPIMRADRMATWLNPSTSSSSVPAAAATPARCGPRSSVSTSH